MGYLELAKRIETEGKVTTATHPVPPETPESIFQECLADLNRRTVQGLFDKANFTMLTQERQAKDHLDKTWKECLAGKATLETFRQAVKGWHGAVIALFTSPQGQKAGQGRLL